MTKNNFPPLLHLTYILQQVSDEVLYVEVGIGLSQARVMSVLSSSLPKSQREIAKSLSQTEANISRLVRQMHKNGLLNIKHSKKDSRQREVLLTAKGQKTYQQAEKLLRNQQAKFLRSLKASELNALENTAQLLSAQHNL